MKGKATIATVAVAILAGTAGWVASMGMGDASYLAGTPIGRWLGVRTATATPGNGVQPARNGESVGALPLTDLGGKPATLPSGRRVLVNVWASWCSPCREEMPLLARYAAAQGTSGVAVIGVAEDEPGAVRDFLRDTPITYPIVLDDPQWRAGTRLGNGLGVLPFTALLDADGRLLRYRSGPFASEQAIAQWVDGGH